MIAFSCAAKSRAGIEFAELSPRLVLCLPLMLPLTLRALAAWVGRRLIHPQSRFMQGRPLSLLIPPLAPSAAPLVSAGSARPLGLRGLRNAAAAAAEIARLSVWPRLPIRARAWCTTRPSSTCSPRIRLCWVPCRDWTCPSADGFLAQNKGKR